MENSYQHLSASVIMPRLDIRKAIDNSSYKNNLLELVDKGIKKVKAVFKPTNKNMQTENFYDNFGFKLDSINNGIKNYHFILGNKYIIKDLYNLETI